jgi:hypothetical protein
VSSSRIRSSVAVRQSGHTTAANSPSSPKSRSQDSDSGAFSSGAVRRHRAQMARSPTGSTYPRGPSLAAVGRSAVDLGHSDGVRSRHRT